MGDGSLALRIYPELCLLGSGFHSNFLAVLVQSSNFLKIECVSSYLIARQF